MIMLSNGRLARAASRGKIGIWSLDDLPTHGSSGTDRIGGRINLDDTWRDELSEIEDSAGSSPQTAITLPDDLKELPINVWNTHPSKSGTLFCGQESLHALAMVDLERGGILSSKFLGHGGRITGITTSPTADPNVFCTGCDDGLARLFDVRQQLPVLTVEGDPNDGSCCATFVHPDGIPVIFTGARRRSECIRTWDVRARAAVYELATGNNAVDGLAWDSTRNTLYALTSCLGVDRMGYHHDYRPANFREGNEATDEDGDEDDDEDDDEGDDDRYWPGKAYNPELYFEYGFDAGEHRVCKWVSFD